MTMTRDAYIRRLTRISACIDLAEAEIYADAYEAAGIEHGLYESMVGHACAHLMAGRDRTCEPSLGASAWAVAEHTMRIGAERGML